MKHRGWIAFSGLIWLLAGCSLLYKGLHFISDATKLPQALYFQQFFGSAQSTGTALIAIALGVGFLKSRFIFTKTVQRVTSRIYSLPLPVRLKDVYAPSYWVLIGSMMGLGFSMRYIGLPLELRGLIDAAIGSALVNGAMLYFRVSRSK